MQKVFLFDRSIQESFKSLMKIDQKSAKSLLIQSTKKTTIKGTSTCTIIIFDDLKRKIYTSYIGDSCYLILRPRNNFLDIIFKSKEQYHKFNLPFQIGIDGDNPENAICMTHAVQDGDIIVVGTDGLWDNLEIDQINKVLEKFLYDGKLESNSAAKALADEAQDKSIDPSFLSPFSKKARENGHHKYTGGKPDDITVVVAQIKFGYEIKKEEINDISHVKKRFAITG